MPEKKAALVLIRENKMFAKIYRPTKTAMQSGRAKTKHWVLEFEAETARRIDPLMGWTSGADTSSGQVRLSFDTKEAAISYCEERALPFQVIEAASRQPQAKAYSDNFAFTRRKPWTH